MAAIYWNASSLYTPSKKPFEIKKAITKGSAGVTQPGARGSPNIIGPDVISVLAIREQATACSKLKPKAITIGAPAKAVAPEITKP